MKIKKIIPFLLFVFCTIQVTLSQKIHLTYKVKSIDSVFVFENIAFSDEDIETKPNKLFLKNIPSNGITYIEDNINRRFDKIIFNKKTYFPKLLNTGYYRLYELNVNDKPIYFIYSKKDTLILQKNDSVVDDSIKIDRKYNRKLVFLCRENPDLWEQASKIDFRKEDLQNFISVLNDKLNRNNVKKQEKKRVDYLGVALKGMAQKNKTNVTLDVLMSQYFLYKSSNISLRYGLRGNYFKQTVFFPEINTGEYTMGSDGIKHYTYIYLDHYETINANAIEIPLMLNMEITNSKVTPYFNWGIAPIIIFKKITRTDSNEIISGKLVGLGAFVAAGIKLKLTNNFNILSEYKLDAKGLNFNLGIEYFSKL